MNILDAFRGLLGDGIVDKIEQVGSRVLSGDENIQDAENDLLGDQPDDNEMVRDGKSMLKGMFRTGSQDEDPPDDEQTDEDN